MEIWDAYDKYKNLTGRRVYKEDDLKEDEYTLVVHLAIFNSENEMLIQKRQSTRERYPNLWDISTSGHVISGETSEEAIEREAFEELGYIHDFSEDRPYMTFNYSKKFGDVYIVTDELLDINNLKLQYEEVQNITWASKEEIFQLIEEEKFIPYSQGFIELLFFNKEKRGIIK